MYTTIISVIYHSPYTGSIAFSIINCVRDLVNFVSERNELFKESPIHLQLMPLFRFMEYLSYFENELLT